MKKVELVPGIHSSVLGLGCAPILGSSDAKTCRRILEMAYDTGINHFDLARSYGYGEAEGLVGGVFKNRRDKIILASKFGIKADWKAGLLSPIKPIVRALRDSGKKTGEEAPGRSGAANAASGMLLKRIKINSYEMRRSLEKSLRALHTDYLDYFLVHEPLESIINIELICETALQLKAEGKIRAFGLAYMQSQKHLHETDFDRFDIRQFNSPPLESDYNKLVKERAAEPNIFFSPMRGGTELMTPQEKIGKLLTDFPKSVILCAMFSEKHLKENAGIVGAAPVSNRK
jgi:aryl-alcohol dehydrogenase-like predicted oxidoreductase